MKKIMWIPLNRAPSAPSVLYMEMAKTVPVLLMKQFFLTFWTVYTAQDRVKPTPLTLVTKFKPLI